MNEHEIAADHRAARQSVVATLAEVGIVEPGRVADAILARLAHLDPPLLVVRADALDERDRLRAIVDANDGPVAKTMEYLGQVEAERNRLRVVVDAALAFRRVDFSERTWSLKELVNAQRALFAALDALDGSAEATDG
jgi:hypothetical protein